MLEPEDVVESVESLAEAVRSVAASVVNGGPGRDASGGYVGCLTEAVMGVSTGLHEIAEAIRDLASAVRSSREE